jgi:uncharacterized membrane protein
LPFSIPAIIKAIDRLTTEALFMHKGRLEAFSDGFFAVIITIMVLEMKVPLGATLAALMPVWPVFLCYSLSFIYLAIYWNNHHHMFQITRRVSGGILWANLHLLFWLSLIPFVTGWMGENHFAPTPTALYGAVLLLSAISYWILQSTILLAPGGNPVLATALGRDLKGKMSMFIYAAAIVLSLWRPWIGCCLYVLVAMIWLIPDRRIERAMSAAQPISEG